MPTEANKLEHIQQHFPTLFTPCIFIELLTREVPTVMDEFNICDTKFLEVHFHFDMFQWCIYHHHQEERVHTESWDTTGEIKVFLAMYTLSEWL
jgi:hypothetical protein